MSITTDTSLSVFSIGSTDKGEVESSIDFCEDLEEVCVPQESESQKERSTERKRGIPLNYILVLFIITFVAIFVCVTIVPIMLLALESRSTHLVSEHDRIVHTNAEKINYKLRQSRALAVSIASMAEESRRELDISIPLFASDEGGRFFLEICSLLVHSTGRLAGVVSERAGTVFGGCERREGVSTLTAIFAFPSSLDFHLVNFSLAQVQLDSFNATLYNSSIVENTENSASELIHSYNEEKWHTRRVYERNPMDRVDRAVDRGQKPLRVPKESRSGGSNVHRHAFVEKIGIGLSSSIVEVSSSDITSDVQDVDFCLSDIDRNVFACSFEVPPGSKIGDVQYDGVSFSGDISRTRNNGDYVIGSSELDFGMHLVVIVKSSFYEGGETWTDVSNIILPVAVILCTLAACIAIVGIVGRPVSQVLNEMGVGGVREKSFICDINVAREANLRLLKDMSRYQAFMPLVAINEDSEISKTDVAENPLVPQQSERWAVHRTLSMHEHGWTIREVSVLHADFARFSSFAAKRSPPNEDTFKAILSRLMNAVYRAVKHNRGNVDTFYGDSVVMSFNTVSKVASHFKTAAVCALAVVDGTDAVMQGCGITNKKVAEGLMYCGIDSGRALFGNCGTEDFARFTMIGSLLRNAAMLAKLSFELSVSASHSGYHSFADPFDHSKIISHNHLRCLTTTAKISALDEMYYQRLGEMSSLAHVPAFQTLQHQLTQGSDSFSNITPQQSFTPRVDTTGKRHDKQAERHVVAIIHNPSKYIPAHVEWMYGLEIMQKSNPYTAVNAIVRLLDNGQIEEADHLCQSTEMNTSWYFCKLLERRLAENVILSLNTKLP